MKHSGVKTEQGMMDFSLDVRIENTSPTFSPSFGGICRKFGSMPSRDGSEEK